MRVEEVLRRDLAQPPSALRRIGFALPTSGSAPPSKESFEAEEDGRVTPDGNEQFWVWLDDVPKAPWDKNGTFGEWKQKMTYKTTPMELHRWVDAREIYREKTQRISRADLFHMLATACAAEAEERAAPGPPFPSPQRKQQPQRGRAGRPA